MSDQVSIELFKKEFFECLDETFAHHHGIYLDRGASLFETLKSISAADASRSLAEGCATIAAHVEHVRYYLDVLNEMMQKEKLPEKVDWRDIWQNVRAVTPEEWQAAQQRLAESYERVSTTIKTYESWDGDYGIAGALAVLVHTAYHLGGIRQAWAAIKSAS